MLSHRRRTLLTLASYGTWDFDLTSFPYVYNSLLTKGSEVVKGKIAKIYANGVIENQLLPVYTDSSWYTPASGSFATITKTADKFSMVFTQNAPYTDSASIYCSNRSIVSGHKYLVTVNIKHNGSNNKTFRLYLGSTINESSTSVVPNVNTRISYIVTSNQTGNVVCGVGSATIFNSGETVDFSISELVNLTQKYPFDTPTTLTDNRIQNLLNRGYIAYNTGEYKGTNVSEIATEPYNLFDGELEQGGINQGAGYSSTFNVRSKNFMRVVGGISYTFCESSSSNKWKNRYVVQYDANKNWIRDIGFGNSVGGFGMPSSGTLDTNCCYIKIKYYAEQNITPSDFSDIYFTRTGTRTGYAKHKPSVSIPFIYQGNGALNAHDTFEITSSEYVFTKNVSLKIDMGNLTWIQATTTSGSTYPIRWRAYFSNYATSDYLVNDLMCEKYETIPLAGSTALLSGTRNKVCALSDNTRIDIVDSAYNSYTAEQVKNALNGTNFVVQLATPQVIRIPRKHLGIVDLGSLSWNYDSTWGYFTFYNYQNVFTHFYQCSTSTINNAYISKYATASRDTLRTASSNNVVSIHTSDTDYITIKDTSFNGNVTNFKQAMSGIYLFYETADEVDDIATRIFTENGGTVTTDSEILPNLDLDLPVKV